jgi:hypothetical protein
LYNLKNDPTEINNLADSMTEKVEELKEVYNQKQNELKEAAK